MNTLVYQEKQGVPAVALLRDGALYEYRRGENSPVESIHAGRVGRVMKELNACFVRLHGGVEGFLPFEKGETPPRPGDTLYVQVKKPAIGGKAPFLTRDLAFTGRYVVYLPMGRRDAVSGRIEGKEARGQAQAMLAGLCRPEGAFIGRTLLMEADPQTVQGEARQLVSAWESIKAGHFSAPALVRRAPRVLDKMLRDIKDPIDEAVTDAPESLTGLPFPVRFSEHPMALFNAEDKLRKALKRRIYLKSGAEIVIDPCEAMTVVDVNSALSVHKSDRRHAALNINLEAAAEIARVLRLRGIGGMVAVDFIDMQSDAERDSVRRAMEEQLQTDRVKTTVHGFTALGLLEMTRMRSDEKLEAERAVCPHCQGSGILPAPKEEEQGV